MKKIIEHEGKHFEKEYDEHGSVISIREVDVNITVDEKKGDSIKARVITKTK